MSSACAPKLVPHPRRRWLTYGVNGPQGNWGPALALLFGLVGCGSPVVGGECLDHLSVCDGRCVNLSYDPGNCGACGVECGSGETCNAGMCVVGVDAEVPDGGTGDGGAGDGGTGDGGMGDGGAGDGGTGDGGMGDGGAGDGGTGDGGMGDGGAGDGGVGDGGAGDGGTGDGGSGPSCDVGEIVCDGVCVDPQDDPDHCGTCGNGCADDEFCAAGTCNLYCDPPLEQCDGQCIDVSTSADHCGECDNPCESGICIEGMCSAGAVGHVVVIGHDYTDSRAGQNRVAGNAVFLASGMPVRVLVYEGDAARASIQGVDRAIDQVAGATGRTWQRTAATADLVPFALAQSDVFLIYSQHGATDGALRRLGVEWAMALETFVRRGGIVVLFDGGGSHDGTWQILDSAGLYLASGRAAVSGDLLEVVAPGDAVAVNVPRTYRAESRTVRFETNEPDAVVEHADGPVVVHRVVVP